MNKKLITVPFRKKVLRAMQHPYVWPEIEQLTINERLLAQNYLYDDLKKEEFDSKLKQIQSEKPSIIVTSIQELELIMEILNVNEDIKKSTLQDMIFKYDKAVKQGYPCRFSVWFYRGIKGGVVMYSATQIKITKK